MNYIKSHIKTLCQSEPMVFVKKLTNGLDAYFEYYSLLQFNNIKTFITEFEKNNVFEIYGVNGAGKSSFKTIIRNAFFENIKVFEYNCSEITELDDIFFALYKFIIKNPQKKDLIRGGVSTFKPKSMDEQIINYLKNAPSDVVLIFDNVEKLISDTGSMKAKNTKSFFEYVSSLKNIKLVLISNASLDGVLNYAIPLVHKTNINKLDADDIESFLAIFKIDAPKSLHREIYEKTGGNIFVLRLFANVSKILNISADTILKESELKGGNLTEYLLNRLIKSLSDDEKKILKYLSAFRHEVTAGVLNSITDFRNIQDSLSVLKKKLLLEGTSSYSLRNSVRDILYSLLSDKEKMQIHEAIADLYAEQIPLKPSERVIEISRTSMYSEKFYHYNLYEKINKNINLQSLKADIKYMPKDIKPDSDNIKYIASTQYIPDLDIKDDTADSDKYADAEEKDMQYFMANRGVLRDILDMPKEKNPLLSFGDKLSDEEEKLNRTEDFELSNAEELLKQGLDLYNEGETDEAISYLQNSVKILDGKDNDGYCTAKLTLAKALSDNFKYKEAEEHLTELIRRNPPPVFMVDSMLELAAVYEYENRSKDSREMYDKAMTYAKNGGYKELFGKIYFKTALYYDDKGETEKALYSYLMAATDTSGLKDKTMLASVYSNIASIYDEKKEFEKAAEFYKKAIRIDEYYKNYEGQTRSLSALGNIFLKKKETDTAISLLVKASQVARQTGDSYIIASSYLELGDAFFRKQDYKNAIKAYLLAKNNIDATISTDSKNKIERRFSMIVDEIGENAYRYILQGLKRK